ncbi:MAG: hypothetical protein CMK59_02760 [Proteobacteria bacterium]|nr:hypothetical protein [Pseudomonadota bacterium]
MYKKEYPLHKIMYIHGMEGTPTGTKGRWVTNTFAKTCNPTLEARRENKNAFKDSLETARKNIEDFKPDLVIGSSFGGAVTIELMHQKVWSGSTILLAPAHIFYGQNGTLPLNSRAIIIHSPSDKIVPYAHSLGLMSSGGEKLELWNASTNYNRDPEAQHDGNHRLHDIISNNLLWRACNTLLNEIKK